MGAFADLATLAAWPDSDHDAPTISLTALLPFSLSATHILKHRQPAS